MAGEAQIVIPGTKTKVPKWAPLAVVGVIAGILLLRPKSSEQGDFNEEGTAEEEGAGFGLEDLLAFLDTPQGLESPSTPLTVAYDSRSPIPPLNQPISSGLFVERTAVSYNPWLAQQEFKYGDAPVVSSIEKQRATTTYVKPATTTSTLTNTQLQTTSKYGAEPVIVKSMEKTITSKGGGNGPITPGEWILRLLGQLGGAIRAGAGSLTPASVRAGTPTGGMVAAGMVPDVGTRRPFLGDVLSGALTRPEVARAAVDWSGRTDVPRAPRLRSTVLNKTLVNRFSKIR